MKTFWMKLGSILKEFFVSLFSWILSFIAQQKFWALALALLVFLLKTRYPFFEMNIEVAGQVLVMFSVYMVGVIQDPGPNTWKKIFSRKLFGYVISLAAIVLNGFGVIELLGIPLASLYGLLGAMGITILAVAAEQKSAVG